MKSPLEVYLEKTAFYTLKNNALKTKINRIGWLRFGLILALCLIEYFQYKNWLIIPFHVVSIILAVTFLVLVNYFNRLKFQARVLQEFITLNQGECDLISDGKQTQFHSGDQFIDFNHPYSYDLDVFGQNSLYQRLNRANTFQGQQILSNWLTHASSIETIVERQNAILELSQKPDVYQEILVYSKLGADDSSTSKHFAEFQSNQQEISVISKVLSYVLPALGLSLTILLWTTGDSMYFKWASLVFVANITHFNRFRKRVIDELGTSEKLSDTIQGYSRVLALIEQHAWQSKQLQSLQQKVSHQNQKASDALKKLARIIQSLESVHNGFAMAFFNGTVQFHLHIYKELIRWKKLHGSDIETWITTMGEFEALISLANFHYNFPETNFPKINGDNIISFEDLGHPLLNPKTRIPNSIDFSKQSFTILTGSNMSGKSTFLRTVGLGVVLANAGGPVCAKSASFTPIDLAASMRLTDSLSESTSYFYAEVKRLELIVKKVQHQAMFVLLDEILRGTNSDDKKSGTIGVIEKIIQYQVFGLIATHDLEVCETAHKHPDKLINRCFEVDFHGDNLYFDYTLRDGICKNKSATFIMKKHGVI